MQQKDFMLNVHQDFRGYKISNFTIMSKVSRNQYAAQLMYDPSTFPWNKLTAPMYCTNVHHLYSKLHLWNFYRVESTLHDTYIFVFKNLQISLEIRSVESTNPCVSDPNVLYEYIHLATTIKSPCSILDIIHNPKRRKKNSNIQDA